MLKRRQLNTNKSQQPGQSQPRPQQQRPQQQQKKHQGQNQGQGQGKRKNRNRRGGQGRPQQRPAPPPAFLQRDVLLIADQTTSKSIEEVRKRFDPLSKKIPAHVTLLFSEAANKIAGDILKTITASELPSLDALTFKSIQVVDDMYLWLMPDEESATKMAQWHAMFAAKLTEHTQEEKYVPHLTLGYIPRKVPEEEALAFAQNLISTPLTVKFNTLLLEEFSEDQNSRSLDRISISSGR